MLTWALENSVDTADSMKARGFGSKGRTSFSLYRFSLRDGAVLAFLLCCIALTVWGLACGGAQAYYFPGLVFSWTIPGIFSMAGYALLCLTPVLYSLLEVIRWHSLQSAI